MQAIMPSNRARGTHAFRPALAVQPSIDSDSDDERGSAAFLPVSPASAGLLNVFSEGSSSMIVDNLMPSAHDINMSPPSPPRFLDPPSNFPATLPPQSSAPQSTTALSISAHSSKGKRKFSATSDDANSSKKKNSKRKGQSGLAGGKISQAVAMHGMQGTLNRLTDVFERSMTTFEDGTVSRRDKAMRLLQEVDDGLSSDDKVIVVASFMNNSAAADTYLSLTDDVVRRGWLRRIIASD
jgi:hypothetical protein